MTIARVKTWTFGEVLSAVDLNVEFDNLVTGLNAPSAFSVTATGSTTARTLADRFVDIFNVKDFGAIGNGSTDDTAAIQAAITATQDSRGALYFPPGTYKVTSTLTITGSLRIYGEARYGTSITWTNTTLNVITVTTPNQVAFEGLTFTGPAVATAGAILTLTATANHNSSSYIKNCTFVLGYNHIVTTNAYVWVIDGCTFSAQVNYGVYVSNTFNVDAGDSSIINCVFSGSTAGTAILQVSSGGLKIKNNKILSGSYAYRMVLASGAVTSICLIEGNSIELQTTASISAVTSGGGAAFTQLLVSGNQFAQTPKAVALNDAANFLKYISITGNTIALSSAASATGFSITNASNFIVQGNLIVGGGGTTPAGISIGASCTAGHIGANQYVALSTNVSVNNTSVTVTKNGPILLKSSGIAVTVSATTAEEELANITVPANLLGINGYLKIRMIFNVTNGVDDKIVRLRYSTITGTAVFGYISTTVDYIVVDATLFNRNLTNSQITTAIATVNTPAVVPPVSVTSAIDTTVDTTLVITGQKETAGNTLIMSSYFVELVNG